MARAARAAEIGSAIPLAIVDHRRLAGPAAAAFVSVTVVIEARGCWNPELGTAMGTQLADRYRRQAGLAHGIYLVYWFPERNGATMRPIGETERQIQEQASALSVLGLKIEAMVLDCRLGGAGQAAP